MVNGSLSERAAMLCAMALVVTFVADAPAGEDQTGPFVAGFDRFARHGDVEPPVGGRLLLAELSCTACHAADDPALRPKRGPRLDGAGDRLQGDWLRRYLAAPQAVEPGTTMPDVLAGLPAGERAHAAEALAAFLATRHEPFPEFKAGGANPLPHEFWIRGDAGRGRELYHRVGCVACHEPDADFSGGPSRPSALDELLAQLDADEIEAMGLGAAARPVRSVPHGDLAAKYSRKSLTFFLADPQTVRPDGRMPSLKLQPVEAADIAAYLLREQPDGATIESGPEDQPLAREGQRLFVELSCANCHSVEGVPASRHASPLAELRPAAAAGCLGDGGQGRPRFRLDEQQNAAIRAALAAPMPTPVGGTAAATDRVEFAMLQQNCYACHQRGGRGGVGRNRQQYFETVGHIDLGDEGRLPPPLDHAGRKLTPEWLTKVLGGTGDVRPYMLARMPRFPSPVVTGLPESFAAADLATPPNGANETETFGDRSGLAEPGRLLLDTGCVQCHPLRGESLPGTIGVDLAGVPERVRPEWFRDFLRDPAALKPRTRMPTFFPNGRSTDPFVLGGDVDRQIAAVWTYLKEIERQPLPDKIEQARSREFELTPEDRPILLRTFMEQAGTHAVAVGFPAGVHFAFDAETVRPAVAWRGRFLDAYGTWFTRLAPPADPLEDDVIALPPGVPLAVLRDDDERWPTGPAEEIGYRFSGYRLDRAGVPTFLYRVGRFDVEDRIEPNGRGGLKRRLLAHRREQDAETADDKNASLWFRAHAAKKLKQHGPLSRTSTDGLTVSVPKDAAAGSVLREADGVAEWLVPLVAGQKMDVEYQW
jgi:mono/diheme cytochrome c family protein